MEVIKVGEGVRDAGELDREGWKESLEDDFYLTICEKSPNI